MDSDSDSENIDPPKQTPKKPKVDTSSKSTLQKTSKLQEFTFGSDTSKSSNSSASKSKPIKNENIKDANADEDNEKAKWLHEKIPFLKPDKIMDANRRMPDHPDYDKRTLYVPRDYLDSLTPGMRQWWELKSAHFDTVLFFKVGKFYELYHMDATVGVECLGFTYMKVTELIDSLLNHIINNLCNISGRVCAFWLPGDWLWTHG